MRKEKYVVLEHLTMPSRGMRFWTTNSSNNTKSSTGDLWYTEILFTDDENEAKRESLNWDTDKLPTPSELTNYFTDRNYKSITQDGDETDTDDRC